MKYNGTEIINILKATHPDAKCSLNFTSPFELVIAVMLSAQCTDERVNKTTPTLFAKCRTLEAYTSIPIEELQNLIYPCGFYKTKAKNIKLCVQKLINDFNSTVPMTMEELMTLPGIGRKSANVIMLEVFNNPQGIAVDTHAKRISNRIGLSLEKNPEKIEQDLLKIFPKDVLKDVNHLFVYHGRKICTAKKPNCQNCPLNKICKFA